MSKTDLVAVANQIQEFWSPLFTKELRESTLLGALCNKDYQGEIKKKGDKVKVSQINKPNGQLLTIGTDADSFETEALSTSQIEIKAEKRAVASLEFEDLVDIQSQIGDQKSAIREALVASVAEQVNNYLYSVIAPSASAPAHILTGCTDLNNTKMAAIRLLGAKAKWPKNKPAYGLVDPSYYSDIIADSTLSSSLFGDNAGPIVNGEKSARVYGFNMLEDNSLETDKGYFFYEDFMHYVVQREVQIKVSDLHAQKKFGYVISADILVGAKMGIDGGSKVISVSA